MSSFSLHTATFCRIWSLNVIEYYHQQQQQQQQQQQ
jgi:hypothetical protein